MSEELYAIKFIYWFGQYSSLRLRYTLAAGGWPKKDYEGFALCTHHLHVVFVVVVVIVVVVAVKVVVVVMIMQLRAAYAAADDDDKDNTCYDDDDDYDDNTNGIHLLHVIQRLHPSKLTEDIKFNKRPI